MKSLISWTLVLTWLFSINAQSFEDTSDVNSTWDEGVSEPLSEMVTSKSPLQALSKNEDIEEDDEDDTQDLQQPGSEIPGRFGRNQRVVADETIIDQPGQDVPNLNTGEDLMQTTDNETHEESGLIQPVNDTEISDNPLSSAVPSVEESSREPSPTNAAVQPSVSLTEMVFVNKPIKNPQSCIVLNLGQGPACLDPKSFGPSFNPPSNN